MRSLLHRGAFVVVVGAALVLFASWAAPHASAPLSPEQTVASATVTVTAAATMPATPLPASPVAGSAASHLDTETVFSVNLNAGEAFTARIWSADSAVMMLALYAPEATSVHDESKVVAGWELDQYPSYLVASDNTRYVAPRTGTYYLRVLELDGLGDYTIEWAKGSETVLTVSASAVVIPHGGSARIYGAVKGKDSKPVVGEWVELWSAPYPDRFATKKVASVMTTVGGVYSFTVKPTRSTRYKAVSLGTRPGYAMARSVSKTVIPKVYLGRPSVSDRKKYRKRGFYVWGSLRPLHTLGAKTVQIRCYWRNSKGKYVLRKTVSARNYAYTQYTRRYKVKLSLPYRGRWKLVAYAPNDGVHAATKSSSRTITVR